MEERAQYEHTIYIFSIDFNPDFNHHAFSLKHMMKEELRPFTHGMVLSFFMGMSLASGVVGGPQAGGWAAARRSLRYSTLRITCRSA